MRLWITGRARPGDRTRRAVDDEPPLAAVVAAAEAGAWLGGGEPTLRRDLPALLCACPAPGLETDALPLAKERVADTLVGAGLAKVRVRLHAARADAHDWLVGTPGAAKTALRAIRLLQDRGVTVEIAATITRPTRPHLAELVALAGELAVDGVLLERLDTAAVDADRQIALAPRLGLLEGELGRAVARAREDDMPLVIAGVPRCAAPRLGRWLQGDGWSHPERGRTSEDRRRCAACPRRCAGVEAAYVERFGAGELQVEEQRPAGGTRAEVPAWVPVEAPAPRGTAAPRAHVAAVGQPLGAAGETPGEVTVALSPEASTRRLRQQLVRLAQSGARRLRVVPPSLAHPAAVALLHECTRLGFEEVQVEGDPSPLAEVEDALLFPLRGKIAALVVPLEGPDAASHDAARGRPGAFDAALAEGRRFAAMTGAKLAVKGATDPEGFAARWPGPEPLA